MKTGFAPQDIGILSSPYSIEEKSVARLLRMLFADVSKSTRPTVGTVLGMMGRESLINILRSPKTNTWVSSILEDTGVLLSFSNSIVNHCNG